MVHFPPIILVLFPLSLSFSRGGHTEGHETVAKVIEVILLQSVLEGGSFASSIEFLVGCSLDEGLVEGASDREI